MIYPTQQIRGMDVGAKTVMEEVVDEAREEDSTLINEGAPTVKTLH